MFYIPFDPVERWIKWKDIERQPYHPFSREGYEWSLVDNQRLLLIALDRYADYLKTPKDLRPWR